MSDLIETSVVPGPLDRLTITVRSKQGPGGNHLILRLGNDGRIWAWEPETAAEVFTLRLPDEIAYSVMTGLLAHFYDASETERLTRDATDWRTMYERERARTDLLLDKLL